MFEVEQEQSNSDASTEVSSEPQQQAATQESETSHEGQTNKTTEDFKGPFHEHPRWKEREEQWSKKFQDLEARLQKQSEAQAPKQQQTQQEQKDELFERLKGIDKPFGERLEQMWNKLNKVDQIEQMTQAERQQTFQKTVADQFTKLCTDNKVPEGRREYYEVMMARMATKMRSEGKAVGLDSMQSLFKQVHDSEAKYLDSLRRTDRESYVTDKKKDASAPTSQPKGKPASNAPKATPPRDAAEARQQTVSEVLRLARAEREV